MTIPLPKYSANIQSFFHIDRKKISKVINYKKRQGVRRHGRGVRPCKNGHKKSAEGCSERSVFMATFFLSETSWCVKDAFALPSSCLRSGFIPLGGEKRPCKEDTLHLLGSSNFPKKC